MNDLPDGELPPSSTREEASRDAARIGAELRGVSGGNDPFAAAVRATRMPMIVTDPRQADNPVVFANDSFCRLTGYAREEIVGRNCRFLQGPETDPATVARIRAAVRAVEPIEVDIRNHRKDGTSFWNRLLMAPVRDATGALAYFFASQVDVTLERELLTGLERHNAALTAELAGRLHEQQESEARLRFAAQAGRLGIWELDLRTGGLLASSVCKENFGRDRDAPFAYDELLDAVHPEDRGRMEAAVQRSIATGAEYDIEYRIVQPGGGMRWVQARAQVVRAADGTALRMAGISLDVTERRQAELRLELSEQSLRLATQAAEVGTWDLDLATDVLTWSDRTKAMFGISPDVPCSMADFYAGLHPEDSAATSAAFALALDPAARATYDVEYRTVGKEDGVVRWVAAKGKGLFEDGRCARVLGTAIDITARKVATGRQAFLLALGDRLRALTEPRAIMDAAVQALGRHLGASRVGYGQVQPDDETVVLETGYADGVQPLTGAVRLAAFGAGNIARLRQGLTIVCDDVAADPANNPQTWAAIEARSFVSVPLIRDGRFRASVYVNQRDAHAWPAEDVALIEDVAARTWDAVERSRAEASLRELNETLEQQIEQRTRERNRIFEMSRDLFAVATYEGYLKSINPAWSRQLGCSAEELLAKPFSGIIHPDDLAVAADVMAALQRGEPVHQFHVRLLRADGEPIAFAWSAVPETTSGSGIFYTVGRDITEETAAAAELQAAQEALRQSQKMEAVGQLTGGIAHDFNNLLGGIIGSLELLQRRVAAGRTDGLERYASAAVTSAQRAAALTQRLLAFARRQPLDPKRVEANRLVAGMEDLLRRTLGPGIELEMVLAGGLWPTLCDPNQLESAILNLAINARDAMPEGGRLTVETANAYLDDAYARAQGGEVRPGQYVAVSVTDAGTGMAPDVVAKAFDPFFTTKPTGQGTGLGLSMLYGFVKQSEGHVRIYSELGQGTTFRMYLPRHRGETDDDADGEGEARAELQAEAGETVLVVDDEATVRMLVTETLEELGYAAIEAADGPSGLRILQSDVRIDLLVTDVGLPGLNGRQLADAARVGRPGLRVLFITGYAHNAAVGNGAALEPGMQMLTKPFALDALAKKLREMIEDA